MTSTSSRYRGLWYRTRRLLQKHYRIGDGTQNVLLKQSYGSVHSSDDFLSRYEPLNVLEKRLVDETHCFRIGCSNQETSIILSHLWICVQAFNQLRTFLTTRQKEQFLRCEDWLFSRTGQQHCFEVEKNGIR